MKKLLFILTVACLLIGCSNKKTFQISGTLTNFGSSTSATMLYLKTRTVDGNLVNIDSTFLKNDGTFILKGESTESDLYFLADIDNVFFLRVFVDPGNKIKLTGSATEIHNINIEGSETQSLYNKYLSSLAEIDEKAETLAHNFEVYRQNESISVDELEKIRIDIIAQRQQLAELKITTTLNFIKANTNSIVAAYLVYINALTVNNSIEIEEQLQLLELSENNKFIKLTKKHLEKLKQIEIGKVFPNIKLPDPAGTLISLESLRGKYVLVDFWATWCRPCLNAIPSLKNFYNQYHDKGFEIYSISLDHSKEAWVSGIENYQLNWIHVSDLQVFNSPIVQELVVTYIPHTFLLDPTGKIIAVDINDKELEQILSEMLPK